VATVRDNDVAAFGAFGLDDGGKPREPAAALAVRHHGVAHKVDVVDQDEGDACGIGGRWPGHQARGEAKKDSSGKTASGGHGGPCGMVGGVLSTWARCAAIADAGSLRN